MIINGVEITSENYQGLKSAEVVEFMKGQSAADIAEFKAFVAAPKTTVKEDGTVVERETNWFEIRNWVVDKYAPGIRTAKSKKAEPKLIDTIMSL